MSNYERLWAKVLQRRQTAASSHTSNAHQLAYLKSELIKRLATEAGHSPQSPVAFARSLQDRSAQSRLAQTERIRSRERDKQLRDRYAGIEAEQLQILEVSDPRRVSMETIGLAQQRLEQSRWFLERIPADISYDDAHLSDENYRSGKLESLKAWRGRLRTELLRITSDIDALDPQSIKLESVTGPYGVVARLLDDLDSVTRAIDDASENLKIANGGKPVLDYAVATK